MDEKTKKEGFVIFTTKLPKIYSNIIVFLDDSKFMDNRSEIIREAIDQKIKETCKLIMESDDFFENMINGSSIVTYNLKEEQLQKINVLIGLGFCSSVSEFIRDAIGTYINKLKILPKLLREKNEKNGDKVYKIDTIINGEPKTIIIEKDRVYFKGTEL